MTSVSTAESTTSFPFLEPSPLSLSPSLLSGASPSSDVLHSEKGRHFGGRHERLLSSLYLRQQHYLFCTVCEAEMIKTCLNFDVTLPEHIAGVIMAVITC